MKASLSSMAVALMASLSLVSAHMEMTWPPPLRSKHNTFTTNVDYDMVNPLNADGSNFPCKGYLNLLGTAQASPVTIFQAGQSYKLTVGGGANHAGGSCQASLSFDGGKTFTVIKSFVGGCPPAGSSDWDFTVPADVPSKDDAIFAWSWFNRIGNREMYMNCAVVSTRGAAQGVKAQQPAVAYSSRPALFVANVANGCATTEGSDVQFPNPGPDVARVGSQLLPPVGGTCGKSDNSGGSPGGGSPVIPPTTPTTAPVVRPTTTPAPVQTTTTLPGGIFLPNPTTTLATVTTPAGPVGGNPVATSAPEAGDIGPQEVWTPCRDEGVFNCVGGTRFQRCGSGLWQPFIPVAPGTKCKAGVRYDYIVMLA